MEEQTKRRPMAIAASLVAMCFAAPAAAQDLTLRITYFPPYYAELYASIAERFEETHPHITLDFVGGATSYNELMQQTLRNSIVGDVPDLSHQGLPQVPILARNGLTVPLDPFISAEDEWESLGVAGSALELGRDGGGIHGLPFATTVPVVYYNMDLVRQAGVDGSLPETWEQLLSLGAAIDALDDSILGMHYDIDNNSAWAFHTLVNSQGVPMMTEAEIGFSNQEGLQALELVRRFGDAGQLPMAGDQAVQAFQSGTLGIFVISASRLHRFARAADGNFELAVGALPVLAPTGTLPTAGNAIVMMTQDPERQAAAWAYMKFAVGPAGQTIMAQHTGYIPVNTIALGDEYLGSMLSVDARYAAIVSQLPRLGRFFTWPGDNASRINSMIEDYLHTVLVGEVTPEQALDGLSVAVQALLPNG